MAPVAFAPGPGGRLARRRAADRPSGRSGAGPISVGSALPGAAGCLAVLLPLFALPTALPAQEAPSDSSGTAALTGKVLSAEKGEPVAEALVVLPELGIGTRSREDGSYAFDRLPAGERTVRVRYLGRRSDPTTVSVEARSVNRVDLRVPAEPVEVPELEVTVKKPIPRGKMAGFHRRKERSLGVQVERTEFEDYSPSELTDIFRRMPGVRVVRHRTRPDVYRLEMARRHPSIDPNARPCTPRYFLDGFPVQGSGPVDVNRIVDPGEVAGIEVYRSASEIPARYKGGVGGSRCGVILIWTRTGGQDRAEQGRDEKPRSGLAAGRSPPSP